MAVEFRDGRGYSVPDKPKLPTGREQSMAPGYTGTPFNRGGGGRGGGSRNNNQAQQQAQAEQERQRQAELALQQAQQQAEQKRQQEMAQEKAQQQLLQAVAQRKPYYTEQQISSIKDVETGRNIPVTQTVYVEPQGFSGRFGTVVKNYIRPGTAEEVKEYRKATAEVRAEKEKGKIARVYGEAKGSVSQRLYELNEQNRIALESAGATEANIAKVYGGAISLSPLPKQAKELIVGGATGFTYGLVEKPFTSVATYGLGGLAGAGITAGGRIVTKIPKVGSTIGKAYRGTEIIGGGIIFGGYGLSKAKQVSAEESYYGKGKVIGEAGRETLLFGSGYTTGQKGFTKIQGLIATRGREEIFPLTKDIISGKKQFVEAPSGRINAKEYKELFEKQSQTIPGLKEPIGYHTTPEIFYGKELKVTTPGTSEFPGLYLAYRPSPYFAKISGSTSGKISFKKLLQNVFQPYGRPGTAGVIPTKFVVGKTAKPGQAYVPGIKPEVEAILPVGTEASLINKGFYYTFKGVRLPLDVYKATPGKGTTTLGKIKEGTSYSDISKSYPSFYITPKKDKSMKSDIYVSKISTSYTPSYKTSAVSKLSYIPSYKPSGKSKTSKLSSVVTSYKPSAVSGISTVSKVSTIKPYSYKPSFKPYIIKPKETILSAGKFKYKSFPKIASKSFSVFGRRFGKFKLIGKATDIEKAYKLGTRFGGQTLGASFTIKGAKGLLGKIPKGYYSKQEKEGNVFIQANKYRLSSRGEKREIQKSKRRYKF